MYVVPYTTVPTMIEGIEILLPDAEEVEAKYRKSAENERHNVFPYWTRLWPSAFALARFIREHNERVSGKKVLEIGAGIGLPSFIAAGYALTVKVTDHIDAAVALMHRNIEHIGLKNTVAECLDWNNGIREVADVVLLSDVSYEPASFDPLFELIEHYLAKGAEIIMAIPQRIISARFYEMIEKNIVTKTSVSIDDKQVIIAILKR